jgi:hypothetical protein
MELTTLHTATPPERRDTFHTGAIKAANGDYLAFMASGNSHYAWRAQDHNAPRPYIDILCYRSQDRGRSWQGPTIVCKSAPWGSHAAMPFRPGNGERIYLMATEPTLDPAELDSEVNTLGIRYSDDHGYTWSDVSLVRPNNDPEFLGISAMKPVETTRGTWLWGSHTEVFHNRAAGDLGELVTEQYVLRSEDRGATWQIYPCPSPHGGLPGRTGIKFPRCEEGNFAALPDGRILASLRTIEGHIWWTQSEDDGKSWAPATNTGLAHPCAPAPVHRLNDGRLLIFTHNCGKESLTMWMQSRDKLWVALSDDNGANWGQPRFLAQTPTPDQLNGVCYPDLMQDGDELHIFIAHHFRDTLYLRLTVDELEQLPLDSGA